MNAINYLKWRQPFECGSKRNCWQTQRSYFAPPALQEFASSIPSSGASKDSVDLYAVFNLLVHCRTVFIAVVMVVWSCSFDIFL